MYVGRLGDKGRALVLAGKLPVTHAREIAKVADPVLREEFAADYAAGGSDAISDTEPGRLEDLQDEVGRRLFTLHQVPWKLDVAFAGVHACEGCSHNSLTNPGLFDHGGVVSREMVGGVGRDFSDFHGEGSSPPRSSLIRSVPCWVAPHPTTRCITVAPI